MFYLKILALSLLSFYRIQQQIPCTGLENISVSTNSLQNPTEIGLRNNGSGTTVMSFVIYQDEILYLTSGEIDLLVGEEDIINFTPNNCSTVTIFLQEHCTEGEAESKFYTFVMQ